MANVFSMPPGLASLEMVTVGDARNEPDGRAMQDGTVGYGSVAHTYAIGKYEVTAGQYCEFLNAVAKSDPYGLYCTDMSYIGPGCRISRSGLSGSYTYRVNADSVNRPVNWVSYWDACRFADWLHNNQPTSFRAPATWQRGGSAVC
ncbi:MAG: formylglycine-generating enzyme family protein [Planctomycetes bacterium]|nr:formylglycine-generating enzyme family protein [Planctomycetota bacterium]